MKRHSKNDTSWEGVSHWYNNLLSGTDTYQEKVILPNILRLVDPRPSKSIVELGCGQGYFSNEFAKRGASVIGLDASKSLIETAIKNTSRESYSQRLMFIYGNAENAFQIASKSADELVIILAMQNIKNLDKLSNEMARILKSDGKATIVLNHPMFRVPKHSDWGYDDRLRMQYRKVFKYLSEISVDIDMEPGKTALGKKGRSTKSFHRPLQVYMKAFSKSGLVISRVEEWASHRKSAKGPRMIAEDNARKEVPLFMCLELRKL